MRSVQVSVKMIFFFYLLLMAQSRTGLYNKIFVFRLYIDKFINTSFKIACFNCTLNDIQIGENVSTICYPTEKMINANNHLSDLNKCMTNTDRCKSCIKEFNAVNDLHLLQNKPEFCFDVVDAVRDLKCLNSSVVFFALNFRVILS